MEISELQVVDFALGAYIAGAFTNVSTTVGPQGIQEFMSRPVNKRIYRHDYEDPKSLISAIQAARKSETTQSGKRVNLPALPVVAYGRNPGFSSGEGGKVSKQRSLWNLELDESLTFKILPVALEYRVLFAAWDRPSLDTLSLLWMARVTSVSKFPVVWKIGGTEFEAAAIIQDHINVMMTDVSPMKDESGRLTAVETTMAVSTQVVYGESITLPEALTLQGNLTGYIK